MRTIHRAVMPMSNGTLRVSTRQHINGRGNGSVLLNVGGSGGGSSYSSIDDYTNTTGINPFLGSSNYISGNGLGKSKEAVNSKLESLLVKTKKGKKEKNINFNI